MFRLRFNQVFLGLLAMSFVTAFVLPSDYTSPARSIQGLFYPVAGPARALGSVLNKRLSDPPKDNRSISDVKDENDVLRRMVSELTAQLEEAQRIVTDRQLLGDVQKLCTPAKVVGNDPGKREALGLKEGTLQGIQSGMPVLYKRGVVGKIDRSQPLGSQVLLCTDPAFGAIGQFRRFVKKPDGSHAYESPGLNPPFVRGAGRGRMTITNIEMKETTDQIENPIEVGDIVVLNDPEWERAAGQWLGVIEKIEPLESTSLLAKITVAPMRNLTSLKEVLVMNKTDSKLADGK